jgi:hypothetical protein
VNDAAATAACAQQAVAVGAVVWDPLGVAQCVPEWFLLTWQPGWQLHVPLLLAWLMQVPLVMWLQLQEALLVQRLGMCLANCHVFNHVCVLARLCWVLAAWTHSSPGEGFDRTQALGGPGGRSSVVAEVEP